MLQSYMYGKRIYEASSPSALLAGLEAGINGHGRLGRERLWPSRLFAALSTPLCMILNRFFWIFYWICVHYDGPSKHVGPTEFEEWNYINERHLAWTKFGLISDKSPFLYDAEGAITENYLRLLPWVNRLRRVLFLNGKPWTEPNKGCMQRCRGFFKKSEKGKTYD